MNLVIKKQCDRELVYQNHAEMRSHERNVPLPKYIPMNAIIIKRDFRDGKVAYTFDYQFRGKRYVIVVEDYTMVVRTVYQQDTDCNLIKFIYSLPDEKDRMKNIQRKMRQSKTEEYYLSKQGKYKHMEWDIEYGQCYGLCA